MAVGEHKIQSMPAGPTEDQIDPMTASTPHGISEDSESEAKNARHHDWKAQARELMAADGFGLYCFPGADDIKRPTLEMITRAQATELAERYVKAGEPHVGMPLRLLEECTIERSFGWAFFYDLAKPPESRDSGEWLAGNGPIIIDRRDGSLHETGTAYPAEYYLDNYERTGSPHSE